MAHVSVSIAGKSYRMACGEGEEAHLTGLAADLDGRVAEMRKAFGEIGDMRLQVMAALTLCDELAEARKRLAAAEAEASGLREAVETSEARIARGIGRTAERIERLSRSLSAPPERPANPEADASGEPR